MNIENRFIKYKKSLLKKGRTSYFQPDKIARQDIIDFLIISKKYVHGILLDIGCGDKPYKSIFSNIVTYHYGIDMPILKSSNKLTKDVDCYANALYIPIKSESVDIVLLTQVSEHIPEPELLFKEIYRILKKGGYLLCSVPMIWWLHEEPHDYYRYTKYGMRYITSKVGFEIMYIKPHGSFFSTIGQLISIGIFYRIEKRHFAIKSIVAIFCGIIQIIFLMMNSIFFDEFYSWGYGIVVKK